jgi:prolyl oligopeptidase
LERHKARIGLYGGSKEPHRYIQASVTEDQHYLEIEAGISGTNNQLYIQDLVKPNSLLLPVVSDYKSTQYIIDTKGETLYIYTNRNAPKFKLVKVSATKPGPENWRDVVPEATNVLSLSTGGGYFCIIFSRCEISSISI